MLMVTNVSSIGVWSNIIQERGNVSFYTFMATNIRSSRACSKLRTNTCLWLQMWALSEQALNEQQTHVAWFNINPYQWHINQSHCEEAWHYYSVEHNHTSNFKYLNGQQIQIKCTTWQISVPCNWFRLELAIIKYLMIV